MSNSRIDCPDCHHYHGYECDYECMKSDMPKPNTIIEYVEENDWNEDPDYQLGWVEDFNNGKREVIFKKDDCGSKGIEDAFRWRYPKEKEWRE